MYSVIIISIIIVFDQLLKLYVVEKIMPNVSLEIVKGFFYITYVENFGIAFGLFKNKSYFFIVTTSIIIIVLLYFIYRWYSKNFYITICLAFIVGGAIGNLVDRIKLGYVIDYIHFTFFPPVFNFADASIVCGAIALSILLIFDKNIIM